MASERKAYSNDCALVSFDDDDDWRQEGYFWICDTGASCHMVSEQEGMTSMRRIDEVITVADGSKIRATMMGNYEGVYVNKEGQRKDISLKNVKLVPSLAPFNLFSVTSALDKGFSIGNVGRELYLQRGSTRMRFDRQVRTTTGYLTGARIEPVIHI